MAVLGPAAATHVGAQEGAALAPSLSAQGPEIPEPQVVTPVDGVLQFTLTAKPAQVIIADAACLPTSTTAHTSLRCCGCAAAMSCA
ncbi:MAG: hypothetical protein WDN31_21670 [Hyphomicrobium sp.]